VLSNESVEIIEVARDSARVRWAFVVFAVVLPDCGRETVEEDRSRFMWTSLAADGSVTATAVVGAVGWTTSFEDVMGGAVDGSAMVWPVVKVREFRSAVWNVR